MERTLGLVKPDGVCKHHIGAILQRFESAGLKVVGLKMIRLDRPKAEGFYAEHRGKPFYEGLVLFMTSGPIVAIVWEGNGAIARARELMGATDSAKAAPGTLRREFGTDNRYNLVHGSDSPESAEREIGYFFTPGELFTYGENDWNAASATTAVRS